MCDGARELIGPEIEVAVTKIGLSRNCARMQAPGPIRQLIRERAHAAMAKVGKVKPLDVGRPVEIVLRVKHVSLADGPKGAGKRRLDARTIAVRGSTCREAFDNLS